MQKHPQRFGRYRCDLNNRQVSFRGDLRGLRRSKLLTTFLLSRSCLAGCDWFVLLGRGCFLLGHGCSPVLSFVVGCHRQADRTTDRRRG